MQLALLIDENMFGLNTLMIEKVICELNESKYVLSIIFVYLIKSFFIQRKIYNILQEINNHNDEIRMQYCICKVINLGKKFTEIDLIILFNC